MAENGEESMTKQTDIDNLLDHFSRNTYSARGDVTGMLTLNICLDLFGKDYTYTVINNSGGQLCSHYPSKVVLLDYERPSATDAELRNFKYQSLNDSKKLEELIRQARVARCWTRFIAPVILYKGKHICRSATLAGWQELFSRKGMDMVLCAGVANKPASNEEVQTPTQSNTSGSQQVFDRHRGRDIQLLEALNVKYICDLMVEMKKVKCGFYISSSEKVDKENRYKNFSVLALPYPGCEFFSHWKETRYNSENVHYDWSQELNTSLLDIQNEPVLMSLPMDWENYKDWDLVKLTQNYLLALIQLIDKGSSGLLVHCISGWDRTPLFISLLRLSLWADGAIHKSLPPSDILYLTIAYDWYLFGHSLPDRLSKGQEIMHFCFKMLEYISGPEFSVSTPSTRLCSEQQQDGSSLQNDVDELQQQTGSNSRAPYMINTPIDGDYILPLSQHMGNFEEEHEQADYLPDQNTPPNQHYFTDNIRQRDGSRSPSRETDSTTDTYTGQGCSTDPVISGSMVSNHFSSSPVNVPSRQPLPSEHTHGSASSHSYGSWVNVGTPQMTPPHMITLPKDARSHISSCQEASDLNVMTARRRKLCGVYQMFEEAYCKTVLCKPIVGSGTLSSLLGNVVEKIGFRSGPR